MNLPLRALRFAAVLFLASVAHAGDAIITLQYENPKAAVAAGTSALEPKTLQALYGTFPHAKDHIVNEFKGQIGKLSADELRLNYERAKEAMGQLGNGAFLILNCHSSNVEVGVPTVEGSTKLIPWGELWGHFGVNRPPRLALVVLNGCLGVHGANGETGSPTSWDIEKVKCALHAEAIISGHRNIATADSQAELRTLFERLAPIDEARGANWDIRLDGDKGAMRELKIMFLHQGKFVEKESLTINGLKRSAIYFGRPSEITTAGDKDTLKAREDDANAAYLKETDPVHRFDPADVSAEAGATPFRFEFKPRGKVLRVEFQISVGMLKPPANEDTLTYLSPKEHKPLRKDFSEFAKQDGHLTFKFPSDAQLASNTGATLETADPVLFEQVMQGRVRCILGPSLRVKIAEMVVTYEKK